MPRTGHTPPHTRTSRAKLRADERARTQPQAQRTRSSVHMHMHTHIHKKAHKERDRRAGVSESACAVEGGCPADAHTHAFS